jgi:hypothetical protein
LASAPRSIATEVALLFLHDLEGRIADDPELLVSSEAILSLSIVKRSDRTRWEHWKAILSKHQKFEVVEHMLREPPQLDGGDWESKAARLIRLALKSGVEFFHDPDQHGWVSVRIDLHWETYLIRSRAFHLFLLRTYYHDSGESPGAQAIRAALDVFEAQALFDSQECPVHLRVAEHRGKLYLDLCDPAWRAVEIDSEGWRIVDRPPARFRRSRGAQPLPEPQPGGSLEELRGFFNIDAEGWTLIWAFLVAALKPAMPYPILVLKGEQGAGKSTACRVITSLIDPRTSALRGAPREVRDLVAAARNSWLVCFDNLSHLPQDLADAACRLATGGGFGGRELYSDYDEAVFDATRPLVFNAIPDLGAARPDFLDRALIIEFNDIKAELRRDERQFWCEFERARPRILGTLLDAVSAGIRNLPQVTLDRPPRMADFASWATACEQGLGLAPGRFLEVYENNRAEGRNLALEFSPLFQPIQKLMREGFSGTTTELLARLNSMVNDGVRRSSHWPKAPNSLSNALRRMVGSLRLAGVDVDFSRPQHGGVRTVTVGSKPANIKKRSSPSSPPSPKPPMQAGGYGKSTNASFPSQK